MTIVELLGVAPYGQGMARALLLPVVFASANLLAAARLGSDYRPVSPPARAPIGGIAIGPIVVRELLKVFAETGARRTPEKKRLPSGGRFFCPGKADVL